jgi:hypothetical protein
MLRRLILSVLLALVANGAWAADFVIEPVRQNFCVLGYASGSYYTKGELGCFRVKNARLVLNEDQKAPLEIIGFRFGIAVPEDGGTTYDYLAQTDIFRVNDTLTKERSLSFSNLELCLTSPQKRLEQEHFLSMEIHIKHSNPHGYVTTYAHEKNKYEKLVPKPRY